MRIYKLEVELEVDQSVLLLSSVILSTSRSKIILDFCVLLNLAGILLLTLTLFSSP